MHPQVQNNDLRWDGWNDMATYLMGQYVLSPKRLGGHPVYKQAETVNKENLFIFRDSFYWRFSHVFGAWDGRYPCHCNHHDQDKRLPPKEWKLRNEDITLKILIPAELKVCQSVVIGANEKVSDKVLKCLGTFHAMEGVWSCGKPVYKGPKDYVLMVTGKLWGVKPKLESWGEVVLRAKEASMGPAGGAPWMSTNLELGVWKECDVTVTELD